MEELTNLPFSSIPGVLEYQAKIRSERNAILYPDSETNATEYASLTYKQFNNITSHLAEKISQYIPPLSSDESVTFGILAMDGIKYILSQYALLKLPNVIMFPISPRNSPEAIEHLLKETKTVVLLTTSQFLPLIKLIQQKMNFQSLKIVLLDREQFQIEQLLKNKNVDVVSVRPKSKEELNKVVLILHSSGSTDHPKPIYITNRYIISSSFIYSSIDKDFGTENDIMLTWGPLFHLLAFIGSSRCFLLGCTYALPLCVTFPPKPDELVRNIQVKNGITILLTIPTLLEQLVRELLSEKNKTIGLKPLQQLRCVGYGGAGCPDELCKTLVNNNVILLSAYGSTETGVTLLKSSKSYDKKWNYMQIPNIRKPFLRIETAPNAQNPNEKILFHLPNDPFLAENICNSPDNCYTTGDILLEDPPNSGQYTILGRQDDTLVHINGEKTNPLPMENTIRSSPLVKQVAIVGHNQFCTAALIQLDIEEVFNHELNQIEENIWIIIEEANKSAPSHSRLVRQLVNILPMKNVLPITDKGNLMRRKINQEYSTLINKMYDQFFNERHQIQTEKSQWTKETIKNYLQQKLKSILQISDIITNKSIFDYAIDSLQIIELTNEICRDIYHVPKNFLYEYSSIKQINKQLRKYLYEKDISHQSIDPFHYQLTQQIHDKYINLIKINPTLLTKTRYNRSLRRVFLVTGANGSLANFVIRDLLEQPPTFVKRVYCLLRGSNTKQRLLESFEQRQLTISLLKQQDKRLIILPLTMNLTEQYLGQSDRIYRKLQHRVTDIIHLAWKMDFNQTIKQFEYDCIYGVYNLLRLANSNNMQFHFISSISSASSGLLTTVKEEPLPRQPQIALPQGYAQSKYIAEHLCWTANKYWNIPVNIYRIGQISGDLKNGIWNANEMAAMMIYASAGQLQIMPNVGEDINWIPIDICSASIVDLALKSSFDTSNDQRVYHIINPYSITYQQYLNCLREAGLQFNTVSQDQFIQFILNIKDTNNPLIKLSSFFQQIYNNNNNYKLPTFQTMKTVERCPFLKHCPTIDSNLIRLYLNYWKQSGLFK